MSSRLVVRFRPPRWITASASALGSATTVAPMPWVRRIAASASATFSRRPGFATICTSAALCRPGIPIPLAGAAIARTVWRAIAAPANSKGTQITYRRAVGVGRRIGGGCGVGGAPFAVAPISDCR